MAEPSSLPAEMASPASPASSTSTVDSIAIDVSHRGRIHTFTFPADSTLTDLASYIEQTLFIPLSNQKLLAPKLGLLKPPFDESKDLPLSTLQGKKITLMGSEATSVASFQAASHLAAARHAARRSATSSSRHKPTSAAPSRRARSPSESTYTFLSVRPLPGLPHPERSLALLNRLKADPGIRSAMRAHRFTVGLLTEMEPLSNTQTSHEGTTRLLGLNRNRGEAIELRLRTDAHDGYRDYKTIRKTLCHELAHNVHGPHDRQFWDLCHQIEREVDKADWKHGGRTVGNEEYYQPATTSRGQEEEEEGFEDHGGWQGGEFVLGGGSTGGSSSSGSGNASQGLSRREILAKAAEERLRRMNMEGPDGGKPDPGQL